MAETVLGRSKSDWKGDHMSSNSTMKDPVLAFRTFIEVCREQYSNIDRTEEYRAAREYMTDYIRLLLAAQPIYVERHDVSISVHEFLRDVINCRAKNVTVSSFLNASRILSERHTDPCKQNHSISECPTRRSTAPKGNQPVILVTGDC